MEISLRNKTGIYIAYPTTSELKSIYKPKNYKTKVNDQHTKIGISKDSFEARKKGYTGNFDNEVIFKAIAIIPVDEVEAAESLVLSEINKVFKTVGYAKEWFDTSDHQKVIEIICITLNNSKYSHAIVG